MSVSSAAAKDFKKNSVVVLVDIKDKFQDKIDPYVVANYQDPTLGQIIPKAVFSSVDSTEQYGGMGNDELSEEKNRKAGRKKLKAIASGDTTPYLRKDLELFWCSKKEPEKGWHGVFVKLDGERLSLRSKKLGNYQLKLSDLQDRYANLAHELAGKDSGSTSTSSSSDERTPQTWTATNGRSIEATLISSDGVSVKLLLANGKISTIPLSRLTAESQEQAKR